MHGMDNQNILQALGLHYILEFNKKRMRGRAWILHT